MEDQQEGFPGACLLASHEAAFQDKACRGRAYFQDTDQACSRAVPDMDARVDSSTAPMAASEKDVYPAAEAAEAPMAVVQHAAPVAAAK